LIWWRHRPAAAAGTRSTRVTTRWPFATCPAPSTPPCTRVCGVVMATRRLLMTSSHRDRYSSSSKVDVSPIYDAVCQLWPHPTVRVHKAMLQSVGLCVCPVFCVRWRYERATASNAFDRRQRGRLCPRPNAISRGHNMPPAAILSRYLVS